MAIDAVIITGSNGGIGQALCKCFKLNGYYVIATDLHEKPACECNDYISQDLREMAKSQEALRCFIDKIKSALDGRRLKSIINNAALQVVSPIQELATDDLDKMIQINVMAPFLVVRELVELLSKANGSVINIGSIHAELTKPRFAGYATTKSALHGMTKAMAVELGEKGIRANVISPAATKTHMLVDGFQGDLDRLNKLANHHPLKRIALPEEIANIARILVSDECSFVSGAEINVDGAIGVRLHDPE